MERINWIDWAKAISILLVVMGHSNYSCGAVGNLIFLFHMPFFFFLSGYLFNANKSVYSITRSNITR